MNKFRVLLLSILLILATSCATQPKQPYDWTAFEAADPRSILVLPVLNNTVDIDAPLYALSTLAIPLGEKGYYVFPVNTVKIVLEQEGLYEGEAIKELGTQAIANLFGADSVLYVEIDQWDAKYAVLATTVTVDINYMLDDKDGTRIWEEDVTMNYTPQQNSSGNPLADLVAAAIVAGITRAAPNYIPLMQQANAKAFVTGTRALPNGPYAADNK
ncbi:Putative lipoprotein/NMB1162 [Halioglobus japonicus]|nr:Putative lipoprotein/NMB1162 [Halioglobus japonicus]